MDHEQYITDETAMDARVTQFKEELLAITGSSDSIPLTTDDLIRAIDNHMSQESKLHASS